MSFAPQQSVEKGRILSSLILVISALLFFASSPRLVAQTSSSGIVLGTVIDASNAVVPDAQVTLQNLATGAQRTQSTNNTGQYFFPDVAPGAYNLTFKKSGFRAATLQNVTVDVNKSVTANMQMQVGEVSQTVEVKTTAQAELQTTDAQVGDVIGGDEMNRLPTLTRNALELTQLQPATAPGGGDRG
ncbi:MAG: carboxypeptidase-like regulatory domain-containing protein, partial [Candidatus Acidiferrales bacterium]